MDTRDFLVADAIFHGLVPDEEDITKPGHACLYRVSRPPGASLDNVWLVWIGRCFYRKPRTQVVYRDWDLAFATYWRDISFNASKLERPQYANRNLLKTAVLRCLECLKNSRSELSSLRRASKVQFIQYVAPWHAAIPASGETVSSSGGDRESSSDSDQSR